MQTHARTLVLSLGLLVATVAVAGAIAAGCIFDWQDDCQRSLGFGCAGGSGASSGGSTSGSTSTGGDGGPMGCTDASTCPAVPAGPCAALGTVTCIGGKCGVSYQAGPSPSQQYGSCKTNLCDETGTQTTVADGGNVFVDEGHPCSQYPCVNGKPAYVPAGVGTACMLPGTTTTGYCWSDPVTHIELCDECNPMGSFLMCGAGYFCDEGACVPNHCMDGAQDNGESDMDCGGGAVSMCRQCAAGLKCVNYQDCATLVCTAGKCQMNTCMDGAQNGTETDKDCGGPSCSPCTDGLKCSLHTDCTSGVCLPSGMGYNTCATPTCTDGVQNGSETGIDCGGDGDGGPICPPCATGDGGP